ncbi:hypothetical protein C2S51_032472 [Perilla frutescens var. frutescens]|nr:hypothetical protein C2S51_032472 [Perilla frutescens var. frutescens]
MEKVKPILKEADDDERQLQQAKLEMWGYAFGFTPMAVVKCAIQLQIADVLQTHGGAMTHSELSAAVGCSPEVFRRIMRYLINRHIFKQIVAVTDDDTDINNPSMIISYAQTPLSRLLVKNGSDESMAAIVLMESTPVMLAPWHRLSSRASENGGTTPFEAEHGQNIWDYNSANPEHSKVVNDGMACMARHSMAAIVDQYPEAFNGVGSVVDVGGGDGTTLRTLIKACPWIRGINFDLSHVVAETSTADINIVHVAGDMFDAIPKADAAFLMRVLHDWSDEECVEILKKCRESIPSDTGKVIIAEAVIRDEGEGEAYKYIKDLHLALDMVMLVHTERGKERSVEEWEYVVREAGFTRFTVKHIQAIVSVIEAYP